MQTYVSSYANQEHTAQDKSSQALHLTSGSPGPLSSISQSGKVTTTWLTFEMPVPEVIVADFDEPRSVALLAQEQRAVLATLPDDLEDVDLPLDN